MVRYYCIDRRPDEVLPLSSCISRKTFKERRYIRSIDRMAWGWFTRLDEDELTPREIAAYGLIREPREDE